MFPARLMHKVRSLAALTALACLPVIPAFGQSVVEGNRLTHEQTVERALDDLDSGDVDIRVGAVMLLGKYRDEAATSGILLGLVDDEVRVRRASVVALTEMLPSVPQTAIQPLLFSASDEDVEIRRMVTSHLATLVGQFRSRNVSGPVIIGRSGPLPMELKLALAQRFLDEDVIVRRNMVNNYFYIGIELPDEVFLKLLQDEDEQVRLETVRLLMRSGQEFLTLRVGDALSMDSVQDIRLLFARIIRSFPLEQVSGYLDTLMKDADPEVRTEAALGDFSLRPNEDKGWQLIQSLENGVLSLAQGKELIRICAQASDFSKAYLKRLISVDNAELRYTAVRFYFMDEESIEDHEAILGLIEDPSQRVRNELIQMLLIRGQAISKELMQAMVTSSYADMRMNVLRFTRDLSDVDVEDIVFELLIDEDPAIREDALEEISRRDFADRLEILRISLDDPNLRVKQRAASMLLNVRSQEEIDWLADYAVEHAGDSIASYIKQQLIRRYQVRF